MRERKRLRKVQNKPGKIVEPSCAAPTGTGKLGPIEYQALSERLVTLRELADRCGVSKQAVSKWARKYNEKSKGSVCNATNGASTRGGREDGPVSNRVISFTDEDAETLAKSAAFSAVLASARCLDDNRTPLKT